MLASTSPYRRTLLARLGLSFEVMAPDVDEAALPGESARETALRLAQAKARAAALLFPRALVIGSDQVAELDGAYLGKPGNHENAVAQLKDMRGKTVLFHTALALLNTASGTLHTAETATAVLFRNYDDHQISRYLERERPYDCTGSAKIEGLGIVLVERVTGDDPTALIGLPLIQLAALLRKEDVSIV
ncbi:MAG TPA: Maf family nucleotide pyrophosphatase [Burkholderiales bacterium]|nr:Maf family nucleotide pyrophosphatase [Burkholderiales bacterium]